MKREALKRTWSTARSTKMLLVAGVLGLLGLVIQLILYRGAASIYARGLSLASDACLVVAITIALTEAGPFRNYIEERLEVLMKRMDDPFFMRMTHAKFLRDNFDEHYLQKLRRAATHASLPEDVDTFPKFLSVVERCLVGCGSRTLWRKSYALDLSHELISHNSQTFIKQQVKHRFTYVNLGAETVIKKLPIVYDSMVLPDIDNDELMKAAEAKLECGSATTEIPLTFTKEDRGNTVRWSATVEITVASDPVTLEMTIHSIVLPTDAYVLRFSEPTSGFQIAYQHPEQILPEFCCFGVGGTLKDTSMNKTLSRWEHDGVFLPEHGIVLIHQLVRRKEERDIAREALSPQRNLTAPAPLVH